MPESAKSSKESPERPRIAVGADHAGFRVKENIKRYLESAGYPVDDVGTWSEDSVDYPDFAIEVAHRVVQGHNELGILACGTGIGMAIAANKVGGIRAAVAHDTLTAHLAREHNHANVLALGARVLTDLEAIATVRSFLAAKVSGGRHQRRVDKIMELDREPKHQE